MIMDCPKCGGEMVIRFEDPDGFRRWACPCGAQQDDLSQYDPYGIRKNVQATE